MRSLEAPYLLQALEIALICCNVVFVLCQIKLFIFTVGALGQNEVNKSLLLLLLIYSTCCVFLPVVKSLVWGMWWGLLPDTLLTLGLMCLI